MTRAFIKPFSVRAEPCSGPVGSVIFSIGGIPIKTENVAPYTIAGDKASGYNEWKPQNGTYVLSATAYDGGNGNGTAGTPISGYHHHCRCSSRYGLCRSGRWHSLP
ncbi:MAG: hypothetical protein U5L96_16770 [Owenweeksia sp.]|nr:hypothetical protein [Owenweeksia sp.]